MCTNSKSSLAKPTASAPAPMKKSIIITPTHSKHTNRNTNYDLFFFLLPAIFWKVTPIFPIFLTGIARIVSIRLFLTLHYLLVDKDNYKNKLSQKQLKREKNDYLVGIVLHMWSQLVLQMIFPSMFFAPVNTILDSASKTFWSHVFIVEPLYYFAHRYLHVPEHMKKMHGFHHLSISTLPSTSLVQNFWEHFVYIATFGPAFLVPFLLTFRSHWTVIGTYLVMFDILNAYGHTNIRVRHWIWSHPLSPLKYLFYTPEFHLGHHAYFTANYGLFMPVWDHLCGTYREYKKPDPELLPAEQQDFVFIGHNGGLGHLLTCPEFSVYNVYDNYMRTWLPVEAEFLFIHLVGCFARLVLRCYTVSRYLVQNQYIGRIICICRTPWDYMSPKSYDAINGEIVELIRSQYKQCGTRYFGLGNLNKMKQLNDGGRVISELVKADPYLKDKNIRVWTGDSLTSASVFHQIDDIPDTNEIFYIGANGKIGIAVIDMILKKRPTFKVKIFSRYQGIKHPNVTYTTDLSDILNYKVAVSGKILTARQWAKAFKGAYHGPGKTRYILDYTVPFLPVNLKKHPEIQHVQVGVLETSGNSLLKGHFDICMSHDQNQIYPCHTGCILNMVEKRETDEVGDIVLAESERLWKKAAGFGLRNKSLPSWPAK